MVPGDSLLTLVIVPGDAIEYVQEIPN